MYNSALWRTRLYVNMCLYLKQDACPMKQAQPSISTMPSNETHVSDDLEIMHMTKMHYEVTALHYVWCNFVAH